MDNKKYYIISEDTYHQHIDREVHLYGLLHQLAFTAGASSQAAHRSFPPKGEKLTRSAAPPSPTKSCDFAGTPSMDAEDMENFWDTAIRYGEIADELFESWNIPGRYLVYGDKADLHALCEKELEPVEYYTDEDDGECTCLRCALMEYLEQLECMTDIIAEAIDELDALSDE